MSYVPYKKGHYWDAVENRKSTVSLIVHEAGLGGMSPFAARRLRRLAREAEANKADKTDYRRSYTASSFVPYPAQ